MVKCHIYEDIVNEIIASSSLSDRSKNKLASSVHVSGIILEDIAQDEAKRIAIEFRNVARKAADGEVSLESMSRYDTALIQCLEELISMIDYYLENN